MICSYFIGEIIVLLIKNKCERGLNNITMSGQEYIFT